MVNVKLGVGTSVWCI